MTVEQTQLPNYSRVRTETKFYVWNVVCNNTWLWNTPRITVICVSVLGKNPTCALQIDSHSHPKLGFKNKTACMAWQISENSCLSTNADHALSMYSCNGCIGSFTCTVNESLGMHVMFTLWYQCSWKTFMVHQTFVQWALYILFKFVKSLIRHLGLAIGNVRHVRWFSWTLWYSSPFLSINCKLSIHIGMFQW